MNVVMRKKEKLDCFSGNYICVGDSARKSDSLEPAERSKNEAFSNGSEHELYSKGSYCIIIAPAKHFYQNFHRSNGLACYTAVVLGRQVLSASTTMFLSRRSHKSIPLHVLPFVS